MVAIALGSVALGTSGSARAEQITLSAFDYPPYMDESQAEKGLFCELVAAAYQSVGYKVSFRFYPLKRSTQYVIAGTELGQLGTEWNFSEEARKNSVKSVPLFYYRVQGFYLNDHFRSIAFKTLKDLKGYRLSVIRGSSDAAVLMSHPDLNLDVEEVTTMEQMFKKVYFKRSDLGFAVELSGQTYIAKHYPAERQRWSMTGDAVQGILASVVFSKRYPDSEKYISAFRAGVQRIRKDGSYLRIFEKYYGAGKVPDSVWEIDRKPYLIPKE
ncbi:substrate-binding periplasmic protein [Niveibacterium terrae]|uniref:substrate-binding periplasmic protein n=1 Tax=Niveibacterium terrae TaxID=3373598 RepID=UPI003A9103E7